jgi:hypothetical protein
MELMDEMKIRDDMNRLGYSDGNIMLFLRWLRPKVSVAVRVPFPWEKI